MYLPLKEGFLLFILCLLPIYSYAESHHPEEFLKSIQGAKNEGEQIVQHFCISCHAEQPMIQLGAPRIHSEVDWNPRIKQGLKRLLQHAEEGFNAMPARGGCFECSDEQLILAFLTLLPLNLVPACSAELKAHKKNTKLK